MQWYGQYYHASVFIGTYIEGGQRLIHTLLNEIISNPTGGVLIKNRVHQGDLGGAAPRLRLRWTELSKQ